MKIHLQAQNMIYLETDRGEVYIVRDDGDSLGITRIAGTDEIGSRAPEAVPSIASNPYEGPRGSLTIAIRPIRL